MTRSSGRAALFGLVLALAAGAGPSAATKQVDLDAQAGNGSESQCDLNVLSTFPVKIETVVTNKAVGNAFDFSWPSAGPGGFSSSAAAGTVGGVGAKWTWTTAQSVYSYTGTTCPKDICFLKTSGPDPVASTCTGGCGDDGVALSIAKGVNAGEIQLSWSGGDPTYTVYRSAVARTITDPANLLLETSGQQHTDVPPAGGIFFYRVRGATCFAPKTCRSNADCVPETEGTCVSRGPFLVPGRSLTTTDVTVSSASLTSSIITFFSPPTEIFRATSFAQPGWVQETLTNGTTEPVTVVTEAVPPGCCPLDLEAPHQLNCDGTCVDFMTDPQNCGACGNVCGEGTCCANGNCVSLCPDGQIWCNGECRDPRNDNDNCGACGQACGENTCCSEGTCTTFVCDEGRTWCGADCRDLQNDSDNCGACGNVCGPGTCCNGGACVSMCEAGRTFCSDGLCYDLVNDPQNCGACGNVCGEDSICTGGACVPCSGQGGRKDACDNQCVNLNTDPYNCGACGNSCQLSCPSGFKGVCSSGRSCRCEPGVPPPPPPSHTPVPSEPFCPNPNPDPGLAAGFCPNPSPSGPTAGVCPSPGPPPPDVVEAPVCVAGTTTQTIPPGGTSTICRPGAVLFRDIPSTLRICGEGIPGPDGECLDGIASVSAGTFMRFVPATDVEVGPAHLAPHAVHVIADTSNDGLIQPGETASLVIEVLNVGPDAMADATATLATSPIDLTDDGIDNPVTLSVLDGVSAYGSILGTEPALDCQPVTLHPASNGVPFRITVPSLHPGDTSTPLVLQFSGTVGGGPFSMDVPMSIGIADPCVFDAATGDYDGLEGLLSPMARLVPVGDTIPFPGRAFNAGNSVPMKLRMFCGGTPLGAGQVDQPEIVGLSEATRGPLDIQSLDLNDSANPDDPYFRWDEGGALWLFNMRTENIGTGVFTVTIRIAGRKDYVTGFEMR